MFIVYECVCENMDEENNTVLTYNISKIFEICAQLS